MVPLGRSLVALLFVASSSLALALPAAPVNPVPSGSIHADLAAALAACSSPDCRLAAAASFSDDVAARWSALPTGREGVGAVVRQALADSGYSLEAPSQTDSASLASALLRLYAVSGVAVDASLVVREASRVDASLAAAVTPLVDAIADAQVSSRSILPPDDLALLSADLRETALLATFRDRNAETQAMWAERAAALARTDRAALAAAALRVGDAVAALPPITSASADCDPSLSLPFVVIGGPCNDTYSGGYFLQIDAGGDDDYNEGAGASPFAGVGVGVTVDQGSGNDAYNGTRGAQGSAIGGVGILVDEGGADSYSAVQFSQASAVAGFALLYDEGTADDAYEARRVLNQTISTIASTLGGVAVLVDEGGNDAYHQDGLDGFVYGAADGNGWMLERGGDDTYVANDMPTYLLGSFLGDFAGPIQISAEVGAATAVLVEEGGNDVYVCGAHVRQGCQGAGGAGALGALLDRGGSDRYEMGVSFSIELVPGLVVFPMGQGAGYGPSAPGGTGLLSDDSGDDSYAAEKWAQGFGTIGGGFLLDGGGADAYTVTSARAGARGNGSTWADGAAGAGRDA